MIKNERQFQITSKKLNEFKKAIQIVSEKQDVDLDLKEIQLAAMQAQIEVLEAEVQEYLSLKNKELNSITADNILDLPQLLIKARISKGWSQHDLAQRLKIKEQQIQRYEQYNYETAAWLRIVRIANELEIEFKPIKAKIDETLFDIPQGLSSEKISSAQAKLSSRRTLFAINN